MTKRKAKISGLIILEVILAFYCLTSLKWYFSTELILNKGTTISGVVTNLDSVNQEITYQLDNGKSLTRKYESDFFSFSNGDTLEFKNFKNSYRHINELNPSALIIGLILLIPIIFIAFVLKIIYSQSIKSNV
tara:strand:- start:40 stop:438 length:399 start_codon:yes stop_codon:yes gene_type:complete